MASASRKRCAHELDRAADRGEFGGILASIPIVTGGRDRDQLQLDASARRLQSGLDRARSIARREQTSLRTFPER